MTGSAPESRPPTRYRASEGRARSQNSADKVYYERRLYESVRACRFAGDCQAIRLRRLAFREPIARWGFLCVLRRELWNHRSGRVALLQWSPRICPAPAPLRGLVCGQRAGLIAQGLAGACVAFRPNGWPHTPLECRDRQEAGRAEDRNSLAIRRVVWR